MKSARRRFLQIAGSSGFLGLLSANRGFSHDLIKTPAQTKGPFYPIPEIESQKYFDVDLTRLDDKSPVADGEIIAIEGAIVTLGEQPLPNTLIEVWQACHSGRYNHPHDGNKSPIDPNFQYWGRMTTGEDGKFRFKTILPGKYPGRPPHIHVRVVSPDRPELITQLYFQQNDESNLKDGIYRNLTEQQRRAVTTGLELAAVDPKTPDGEKILTGHFGIVLDNLADARSTRPM